MANLPLRRVNAAGTVLFLLLFVLLPLAYTTGIRQPENSLKLLVLAAGLILFLLLRLSSTRIRSRKEPWLARPDAAGKVLLLYAAWMVFGLRLSVNPGDAAVEVARTGLLILAFFLMKAWVEGDPSRRKALWSGPTVTILLLCAGAGIQVASQMQLSQAAGETFMINYAIGSTMGNKNSLAELLALALPFTAVAAYASKGWTRGMHCAAGLCAMVFLYFLKSLAAWAAIGAAGGAVLLFFRREWRPLLRRVPALPAVLSAGGLVVVLLILRPVVASESARDKLMLVPRYLHDRELFQRNSQANNNSVFERLLIWRNSVRMIRDAPLSGAGTGNWKIEVYKYGIIGTAYISTGLVHYEHPHNDLLLALAENGIPGCLLLLLFFLFLLRSAYRSARHAAGPQDAWLAIGMGSVVLMFFVTGLLGYPWSKTVAPAWLLLAAALIPVPAAAGEGHAEKKMPWSRSAVIMAALVLCSWAAWIGAQRFAGEQMMYAYELKKYGKRWPQLQHILNATHSIYFELDGVSTPVDWYRGGVSYYGGNPVQAKSFFLAAERQHPYHLQLLNDLGSVYEQEGDHESAISYYNRALGVSPLNMPALLNKSAACFNARMADSSYAAIDRVYGNKLSGADKKQYESILPLVLYAKAYGLVKSFPLSEQPAYLERIGDKWWLRRTYILSKKENRSFEEMLKVSRQFEGISGSNVSPNSATVSSKKIVCSRK
jgi:O-antigen ligase